MQVFPLEQEHADRFDSLHAFLEACRGEAEDAEHAQLVSIATEANALDPLAVLESIYETQQQHFYIERKQQGLAIAGAEEAISYSPNGDTRFSKSKDFIEDTIANTIAVGDETLPFFGPHFFCGYSFFSDSVEGAAFPSSTVFVPLWQVAVQAGRCVAIANVLVEADSDVEAIATRIWNAKKKFRGIEFGNTEVALDREQDLQIESTSECGGDSAFIEAVDSALESIRCGEIEKVVIARALDLKANRDFHPLEILNTLRERYSDCYAFSFANGKGQSFIGASPERLVSVKGGVLNLDVLAGTTPRGSTASKDARLGSELLQSEKDLREHRFVFDSVCSRLESLGIEVNEKCRPTLKKLENVQHLHVNLSANVPKSIHLLDLLEALHPTPAVGGKPRESALKLIPKLESFTRGLYAAPIGWVNAKGEGEFLVAIRSAMVEGSTARLFAGVGVVEGSTAEKEHAETNLKFKALMENLL